MSVDCENQADDESSALFHTKMRIYYAAKDGHAIALYTHIKEIQNEEIRNEIIDEVRQLFWVSFDSSKYFVLLFIL